MSTTTTARPSVRTRARDTAQLAARWGVGHALPRLALTASARSGDLHARALLEANRTPGMPVEVFDAIRAAGPLYRSRLSFVTARLETVKEVLGSPDVRAGIDLRGDGPLGRLGGWSQGSAPLGPLRPPSLLAIEPPDHTRLRRLVTRVFSAKAVQRLEERTVEIADALLDELAAETSDPVDLVERYCARLPVLVICEVLGVPTEEEELVRGFGTRAAPSLDLGLPLGEFVAVERSLRQFDAWLGRHVERVRREPGEDLLSQLVAARDDDGTPLTESELRNTAGLVLAAGFETTVNLIGNGVALLAAHPDQRAAAVADDALWGNVVEEVLRFDPPVLLTGRTTERDTRIAGVDVPAGSVVTTLLAGANRDPDVFTDPHRFDITRPEAREHVAFSAGRHFCLGAALARMEGRVALQRLHERHPQLRVRDGAQRRTTRILRGYLTLPVSLGA
ncbi:cytochrome P450 [Nocardioides sp. ChNu-153]|uniref:cytochrome P450 n=1 Tax=unclassified Nocardioides TaxID=2615069 RepID=UPI00240668DF|nr:MULTISPECIES: cytochrome P450 [unclassified Nocardioides]MDF9716707.1 cytochrome P450 [Nocardioides sp. ChNu-99]MDN7121143.1 cytochrome P450 [Nocardioides sp. ChNu-153]